MNDLITNGFYINNQKFTFEIFQIICYALAMALIRNVKQFKMLIVIAIHAQKKEHLLIE